MIEVFLNCIECGWALDDEDYDICPECEGDNRDWESPVTLGNILLNYM